MTGNNYIKYKEIINTKYADLVNKTQELLNKSKTKKGDYKALSKFWNSIEEDAYDNWDLDDYYVLFCDSEAMNPMAESVSKQMVNMLFNIKNLDVLFDLDIYEGF